MKHILAFLFAVLSLGIFADGPKYVFLFIGDGMSVPQRMIADEFSRKTGNGPLAMNSMPCSAMTRTCSANSLVTDSAAAATAIACGGKTNNGMLGVDPEGKKLMSCAHAAKEDGKKVGIISTVTITHATPGGFYAHRNSRGDAYGIAVDLVESGFDFFAGGGLDTKDSKSRKHKDYDGRGEAYAYAEKRGYRIVETKDEFLSLKRGEGKVLTRFTNSALGYSIDADGSEPTIAQLVAKAIEVLDNDEGFFIMAEGGRIDWAGHANDAATNMRDVLALDEAVKTALEFQRRHPEETLVVVTGDHETGGMTMGFAGTGYALHIGLLANQTMSEGAFSDKFRQYFRDKKGKVAFEDIQPIITEAFSFNFGGENAKGEIELTEKDVREIREAFDHDIKFHIAKRQENPKYDGEKRYLLGGVCRRIICNKCGIGWTSGAHTAMPVLTTTKGVGQEKFSGYIDNTDISKFIKSFYE